MKMHDILITWYINHMIKDVMLNIHVMLWCLRYVTCYRWVFCYLCLLRSYPYGCLLGSPPFYDFVVRWDHQSVMICYVHEWSNGVTYSPIVLSVPSCLLKTSLSRCSFGSLNTSFILGVPLDSPKTRCVPMWSLDYVCSETRQFTGTSL